MHRFDGKDLMFFRTQNWQICFAKPQGNPYPQPVYLVGNIKNQRASKSGLLPVSVTCSRKNGDAEFSDEKIFYSSV